MAGMHPACKDINKLMPIQGTDPLTDEGYGFKYFTKYGFGFSVLPQPAVKWIHDNVSPQFVNNTTYDKCFFELTVKWLLTMLPFYLYLLLKFDYGAHPYIFGLLWIVHFALVMDQLEHFILGLHCVCHRPVFQKPVSSILYTAYVWICGPMFGETPETYRVHHIGMHHPLNNGHDDLSTTLPYQRNSVLHFLHYWACFQLMHKSLLQLMTRLNPKNIKWFIAGELSWLIIGLSVYYYRPLAATTLWFLPVFLVRTGMILGNWGQHSFVNPAEPLTNWGHSSTIVNSVYNTRGFNDGYHIQHHCYPSAHYTDLPKLFINDLKEMADHDCIVFDASKGHVIDWPGLTFLLLAQRYDLIADSIIDMRAMVNKTAPRSKEEIIAMLKERTQKPYPRPENHKLARGPGLESAQ